jgi:hypothetical protein
MFVMSKVTRYGTLHNLYIYDKRASGKDGDALCSLRFNNYMMEYISQRNNNELKKRPRFLFIILDNCVGQNKSNCVLKMFSLLCVFGLYDRVILHFLVAGHSHGIPDVGVAHAKRALSNANYNVPEEIVAAMNTVQGINATYIDFRDADVEDAIEYTFRQNWDQTLTKYFANMPCK